MAKVEGLNQRHGRYYVRIVIPKDLRATFKKVSVNLALGTTERRDAILLALIKRAEWRADFEAKLSELAPSKIDTVTPELAALLAARVRAFVLADDDRVRSDLPLLAEMVHVRNELKRRDAHPLRIPQWEPVEPRVDDLSGATEEERAELAGVNAYLDGKAAVSLAGRNLAEVLPLVKAEAAKLGVYFDATTPGARDALLVCLKAYRTAHREVTQRDAGEVIDTPVVLTEPTALKAGATGKPRTLRDVFDRWKTSGKKDRSADAIAACDRALRQFEVQHRDIAIAGINRELGNAYRTWLRGQESLSSKTQRDRLTAIKSLLKFAAIELEWIPKHPWVGLDIEVTTENPRRPWLDAELKTLFASSLHTAFALPAARNGGREAAYWIPLLGLYTGARLGELCQLAAADVQQVEDIAVIIVTDDGEDQKVKSVAGRRSVPVHSELIRLGFLKYVASIKAAGSTSLWPDLPLRKHKPSDYFGRWFLEHRVALGMAGKGGASFHYFRHTVRPLMRRAGHSPSTQDKVTGHETKGSIGSVVYDHHTLSEIREAVEAIRYPALTLPVVGPYRGS